jgi:PAS domain S-box-containing protein
MTDFSRYTILNVDDNAAGRYARSRILRHAGFEIIEAGTGAEALHAVATGKPHLVLLDVHLPDMNGLDVCRLIKGDAASSRILIVQMSATSINSTDRKRGLEGGADGYLTEPVEPEVLIATIKAFLRLRQTEEALRESEERFRRTFEGAPIGMMLFAPGHRLIESNEALAGMLGYSAEELSRINMMDLTHPDDRDALAGFEEQLFQKQIPGYVMEERCIAKSGDLLWVNLTVTTIQGSGGELLGLAMVENITERRRSEAEKAALLAAEQRARNQAEIASRSKDEFLATISHELRTPLNAILGWAHMLRTGLLDAGTAAHALETIERNAQAQSQLIGDLLDVSRIISGKLQLNVQSVQLRPLIEAALETVQLAAEAKQIRLQTFLEETGPIPGDPDCLQQVIWNLLSNAIKFTPEGGSVEVSLKSVDLRVELKVVDTGIGIDSCFLPYVFDRFRQADSSSGRLYGGLGLGLALVRHLVELHGGSVAVQSNGAGLGTTFIVGLSKRISLLSGATHSDLQESFPKPVHLVPTGDAPGPTLDGISILAVDDDPDARELLVFMLQQSGATVRVAASATEALEILTSWKPAVLLADVGLPGQDGYQLIRTIRSTESKNDPPLSAVALTAYASAKDRADALLAGFQEHMTKPIEPADLITTITGLVKKKRASVPG